MKPALPAAVTAHIAAIAEKLSKEPKLQKLYQNCYPNTLETTAEIQDDGAMFLYTGDIPAMWLRDSTAQVTQYLPLAAKDMTIRAWLRGLLKKQLFYIGIDPYANAFNLTNDGSHWTADLPTPDAWVWERKYEIDSLCYPIRLAYMLWKTTNDDTIVDAAFLRTIQTIMALWQREQQHSTQSDYFFIRKNCPWQDTLHFDGRGAPVNITGMTWSGFRPSDDACTLGYPIASNMFAVVTLRQIEEMLTACAPQETALLEKAETLREEIDHGIQTYGTFLHPKYGRIYACETDGFGNYILADDANVPSLLSAPYLGYCAVDDPLYQNTRRFILSPDNPYYYAGTAAHGIGSPHTPHGYIWHIALSMQGLTTTDPTEIRTILNMLAATDADTGYMHEGFDANDPAQYTRPWFAWSNSLFAEFAEYAVSRGVIKS